MSDLYETIICQKIAKIFEECSDNVVIFVKEWLNSSVNKLIINMNPAIISQSPNYIKDAFYDEVGTLPSTKESLNPDNMYWLGYILTYIQYNYKVNGESLWENYDIIGALSSADVLHTLSNKTASETILFDYKKANKAKMKVFGDYI